MFINLLVYIVYNMINVDVSWEEIESLADRIAESIKASPVEPKHLFAVDKQSLIPVMIISRKLDIPITENRRQGYTVFVSMFANTGDTLNRATRLCYCFATAALILRHGSSFSPDFLGRLGDPDSFYRFPWDKDIQKK